MSRTAASVSRDQFALLLEEHARGIHGHIRSLVPNAHDADEVFQDTCARLWEQFDQYQSGTDFRAWACRVAYYKVLKLRERQTRLPRLFSQDLLDAVDEELIVMADALDTRSEALARCREKLSPPDQNLLARYYCEGATAKRVAQALKWSTQKLYRCVRRVHEQLFECIRRTLAEEGRG